MTDEAAGLRARIGEIRSDKDLAITSVPTSCGVDGSYIVERLLSIDIAAFAALAVEGVTPPSEKRYWPVPRHKSRVLTVSHHERTAQILRGLMMCHELQLATEAPHDVVMLDNSLRTFLIYLNNGTTTVTDYLEEAPSKELGNLFIEALSDAVDSYLEILGDRRDRAFAALPKYSTLRELVNHVDPSSSYDDRMLATLLLEPGEFVGPFTVAPDPRLHLTLPPLVRERYPDLESRERKLNAALNSAKVVYYKPRKFLPAFRIELAPAIADNDHALGAVLKSIEFQSSAGGLFEPFPLYLADRMVGHLSVAFPALLSAVTHEMASKHSGEPGEVYLTMHSYRSEGGR
jgi:hypothetical protein